MKKYLLLTLFLFLFGFSAKADILEMSPDFAGTNGWAVLLQSFEVDQASTTIESILISPYDKNKTYKVCISETKDFDNNSDDCVSDVWSMTSSNDNYGVVQEITDVDFEADNNTTYWLKFFDKGADNNLRFKISSGAYDPYPDGEMWVSYLGGIENVDEDIFFILSGVVATTTEECPSCDDEEETYTYSIPCEFQYSNDLSVITGCTEEYGDSATTTPTSTNYHYYHIPALVFYLFFVLFLYVFGRVILELVIRLRK